MEVWHLPAYVFPNALNIQEVYPGVESHVVLFLDRVVFPQALDIPGVQAGAGTPVRQTPFHAAVPDLSDLGAYEEMDVLAQTACVVAAEP